MKQNGPGRSVSSGDLTAAQRAALKAADEISTQVQFARIDASSTASLAQAAKRFDAILHYAEQAMRALELASRTNRAHP